MQFTCIVPVYNVEPYLRQCLDSLVWQSCSDREIIVVDDGSDDGSGAICDEYAAIYDYISVIHQENQGLAAARNTGMAHAQGEWLCFVDSDDWVDTDMLECLQGHILASSADLYRFGAEIINEQGDNMSFNTLATSDAVLTLSNEEERFYFIKDILTVSVRVWGGAYRRSIIEEHGLTFTDTELVYSEDQLFNIEYLLFAQKVVYLRDAPYHYRKRSGSLTDLADFASRLQRSATLAEIAYQVIAAQDLLYFQQNFYQLYFSILNRIIVRDGKDTTDQQLRTLIDGLYRRPHHSEWMAQIRRHGRQFYAAAKGRPWYRMDFGGRRLRFKDIKRAVKNTAKHVPLAWRLWLIREDRRYIRKNKIVFSPVFMRDEAQHVAYLSMAKAASTSISASMLRDDSIPDDYSVFIRRKKLCTKELPTEDGWFTFTFVRNPFARLVSCYESKYHNDPLRNKLAIRCKALDFDNYLHGYIKRDQGFPAFIDQVVSIPWRLDNNHFCSQYRKITDENGKMLVDFVGKYENLVEEYEPIREKYGFGPLKVYNKSTYGDWRDYYTTKLAKKVYRKYKIDVEKFGYEQDYQDLLKYCAAKERRP